MILKPGTTAGAWAQWGEQNEGLKRRIDRVLVREAGLAPVFQGIETI